MEDLIVGELKKSTEWKEWTNRDNTGFYLNLPVNILESYALQAGYTQDCDIACLSEHINAADSILEVGFGYGRVLYNILSRGYTGSLSGIERCAAYYNHVKANLNSCVTLYNADIAEFKIPCRVDMILMMWTLVLEFSEKEQSWLITRLRNFLNPHGKLVIDAFHDREIPLQTFLSRDQQDCRLKTRFGHVNGHLITSKDVQRYAHVAGYSNVSSLSYETDCGRPKVLYLLEN